MPTPNFHELAGRSSDPRFYAALSVLPNPDPILRKAGVSEEVFDAIQADAHVMGELRLVRADLLRFEHVMDMPRDASRAEKRAYQLCEAYFARHPAPLTTWTDARWQMGQAPFRGQAVHEIVWAREGDYIMPAKLLDRPNRRFCYNANNELRYLTREHLMDGQPAEELYFVVNRHWASYDNPYGVALFSSCFWPHAFKHAGFRWFVKFCERFGIPFPIGTYPPGTDAAAVDAFEEALQQLVEAGYAAMQEGGAVQLLEAKGSAGGGKLPQHLLIEAANAEMSKALSSQTLSTESPNSGSRAASQTHRERSADVNEGDREAIAYTLDRLCALITAVNFGAGVRPPTNEFVADAEATKERAEIFEVFERTFGGGSRRHAATELGIELADPADAEDQARQRPAPAPPPGDPGAAEFARADDIAADQAALDAGIEELLRGDQSDVMQPLLRPLLEAARKDPERVRSRVAELYPQMDPTELEERLYRALFAVQLWGQLSAQTEESA